MSLLYDARYSASVMLRERRLREYHASAMIFCLMLTLPMMLRRHAAATLRLRCLMLICHACHAIAADDERHALSHADAADDIMPRYLFITRTTARYFDAALLPSLAIRYRH